MVSPAMEYFQLDTYFPIPKFSAKVRGRKCTFASLLMASVRKTMKNSFSKALKVFYLSQCAGGPALVHISDGMVFLPKQLNRLKFTHYQFHYLFSGTSFNKRKRNRLGIGIS